MEGREGGRGKKRKQWSEWLDVYVRVRKKKLSKNPYFMPIWNCNGVWGVCVGCHFTSHFQKKNKILLKNRTKPLQEKEVNVFVVTRK